MQECGVLRNQRYISRASTERENAETEFGIMPETVVRRVVAECTHNVDARRRQNKITRQRNKMIKSLFCSDDLNFVGELYHSFHEAPSVREMDWSRRFKLKQGDCFVTHSSHNPEHIMYRQIKQLFMH